MIISTLQSVVNSLLAAIKTFIETDLPKLVVAAIIMIVASYLARLASQLVKRALNRRKADAGVTTLLVNLTRWSIIGTGLFISVSLFTNVSSLLTALGLVGFAVSFAFQDVLKNLVAGIIILVQHPFNVGESVFLDGFEGTVVAISSRMTEIESFDGRFVMVPNANSISNPIINYTRSPQRRIELPLRLAYETDLKTLRDTILAAVKDVPGYLELPSPMIIFDTAGELSLGLTVYFWADVNVLGSALFAKDRGYELVTKALLEKGIAMPVSIQSVSVLSNER
jgi:small conductance mechanosensitive channel